LSRGNGNASMLEGVIWTSMSPAGFKPTISAGERPQRNCRIFKHDVLLLVLKMKTPDIGTVKLFPWK